MLVSQIFDEMFGHWLQMETRFLLRRYTRIYIIILACIQTKQYLRLRRRRRQPSLLSFSNKFNGVGNNFFISTSLSIYL